MRMVCAQKSVTERLSKITKNKPRLLSDDISTNILHYVSYEKLPVSYTYKQYVA